MLCPLPGCPSYPLLRDSSCEAGRQAQRPHASSDHTEATLSIILHFDVSLSCMAGTQWPPAKTTLSLIRQNEVPGATPPPTPAQPRASGCWERLCGKAGPRRAPVEGCRGAGGASQGGRKCGGCPRSRHHGAAGSVGLEGGGPAEPAWPLVPWRLLPSISWLTAHQAIGTPLGTACLNPPDACRRFRGVLRPRALAGGFRGRARALESSAVVGSDPVMRKRTAGGGGASHGGNALRGRHRRPEPRGCSAGSSCPGPGSGLRPASHGRPACQSPGPRQSEHAVPASARRARPVSPPSEARPHGTPAGARPSTDAPEYLRLGRLPEQTGGTWQLLREPRKLQSQQDPNCETSLQITRGCPSHRAPSAQVTSAVEIHICVCIYNIYFKPVIYVSKRLRSFGQRLHENPTEARIGQPHTVVIGLSA